MVDFPKKPKQADLSRMEEGQVITALRDFFKQRNEWLLDKHPEYRIGQDKVPSFEMLKRAFVMQTGMPENWLDEISSHKPAVWEAYDSIQWLKKTIDGKQPKFKESEVKDLVIKGWAKLDPSYADHMRETIKKVVIEQQPPDGPDTSEFISSKKFKIESSRQEKDSLTISEAFILAHELGHTLHYHFLSQKKPDVMLPRQKALHEMFAIASEHMFNLALKEHYEKEGDAVSAACAAVAYHESMAKRYIGWQDVIKLEKLLTDNAEASPDALVKAVYKAFPEQDIRTMLGILIYPQEPFGYAAYTNAALTAQMINSDVLNPDIKKSWAENLKQMSEIEDNVTLSQVFDILAISRDKAAEKSAQEFHRLAKEDVVRAIGRKVTARELSPEEIANNEAEIGIKQTAKTMWRDLVDVSRKIDQQITRR
jgi:hypothetical protein